MFGPGVSNHTINGAMKLKHTTSTVDSHNLIGPIGRPTPTHKSQFNAPEIGSVRFTDKSYF
jgi:hypothetical protein